jgi:hypothetical protein
MRDGKDADCLHRLVNASHHSRELRQVIEREVVQEAAHADQQVPAPANIRV